MAGRVDHRLERLGAVGRVRVHVEVAADVGELVALLLERKRGCLPHQLGGTTALGLRPK